MAPSGSQTDQLALMKSEELSPNCHLECLHQIDEKTIFPENVFNKANTTLHLREHFNLFHKYWRKHCCDIYICYNLLLFWDYL